MLVPRTDCGPSNSTQVYVHLRRVVGASVWCDKRARQAQSYGERYKEGRVEGKTSYGHTE